MTQSTTTLHLMPIPIHEDFRGFVDNMYRKTLMDANIIVAERLRTARRWVASLKLGKAIDDYEWFEIPKDSPSTLLRELNYHWRTAKSIVLMSESGTPCVADPGHFVVAAAHRERVTVKPYVGPNSILLSLMASGFNGQRFTFCGYLPIKDGQLKNELNSLTKRITAYNETQIFIETPYRNDRLVKNILTTVNPSLSLCIATDITGNYETIVTKSIAEWKKQPPTIGKRFCIFLLGNMGG